MGGRGIGKSFITDSVLAWYYMIFDKQEIIVSATLTQLSRKLGTKWHTIKAIEKEYPGLSNTRW
jgi:hypothetical protein